MRRSSSSSKLEQPIAAKRFKVLLVDDDLSVLRSMAAALQFDVDVVTCSSGERALTLLREGQFHVLCSDYSMPGMDGLELFERVAQLPIAVACVLLTGSMHFDERASANQYVLTKPTDPARLARVITQLAIAADRKRSVGYASPLPSR